METPCPQLYLASGSPRRAELLTQLGLRYEQVRAAVEEIPAPGEDAADYGRRVALAKARAGSELLQRVRGRCPVVPVLGADTEVVLDGEILGKPRDRAHGLELLGRLSGREHRVVSTVALLAAERAATRVHESRVWFREIPAAQAAAYWASGEPADKAGGYAIQGLGAVFVTHLEGSYSAVMGLPLFETAELLAAFGVEVLPQ